MTNLKGIDVSKHNGVIDWNAVKQSGKVDFAILRAGYDAGDDTAGDGTVCGLF